MEDKTFYPLDKVFNRIIERYKMPYAAKNCPPNTSRATQKSGTPSPNGAVHRSTKTASSSPPTFVAPPSLSSIHLPLRPRRQLQTTHRLRPREIPYKEQHGDGG